MKKLFNDVRFFWCVLAIPVSLMIFSVLQGADPARFVHPTGEFSARFMILALMLTPLQLLFKKAVWVRWLIQRRRALGVAAFLYALIHTVFYLIELGTLESILNDVYKLGIWTGWLALLIFLPLAVTSNDTMVKYLKKNWKRLQRWVYAAAVLTLVHWVFVHNNVGAALVHFLPLLALEIYRVVVLRTQAMAIKK